MRSRDSFRIAIIIVGFRNPRDICACLAALASATTEPCFDIFICENGGPPAFLELAAALAATDGPCRAFSDAVSHPLTSPSGRLVDSRCLALKGRSSRVWVGLAEGNLGYAGGINAWIDPLSDIPCWEGIWILNPDSKPEAGALAALVERASAGNKGMVGSSIVSFDDPTYIHCRAGHRWRKLKTRLAIIGLGDSVDEPVDLDAVEASLDMVSGASMYVTRTCLRTIGPMDERFFLYYEDADWSLRAKHLGLGYASASVVPHQGGTTIGSSMSRAGRSELSVYLESRNRIAFVRKHLPRFLPLAGMLSFPYAAEFLFARSPRNCWAALRGAVAGLKGETGQPPNSFMKPRSRETG
jgi:N-acetylglucosaminyl-diphospho-decaprenol L-rhamnosyltransferase